MMILLKIRSSKLKIPKWIHLEKVSVESKKLEIVKLHGYKIQAFTFSDIQVLGS
jgi:hypothetical protein